MEFISKADYAYGDAMLDMFARNAGLKLIETQRLDKLLSRANSMLTQEIDLTKDDAIMNIKIARQKVRALTAALAQLKGV